jgi:Fe-S cluster biogenesis protein NfuA
LFGLPVELSTEEVLSHSIEQIEGLVDKIENLPDPEARASALALVEALMDFHGQALDRLMEIAATSETAGYALLDKLSEDVLVSNLMLLYGLHPMRLESRVMQALDRVRPHLESHGGNVELVEIEEGVVRLRLHGTCHSCPSSAETLKFAVEAAIYDAAPDVAAIETERAPDTGSDESFVPIAKAASGNGHYNIGDCKLPADYTATTS